MNLDSPSCFVRSFMSDWSTGSVSLPVEENDFFSKAQLKKKFLCYRALSFPLYIMKKTISMPTVRLLVKTCLNNANIPSNSFVFPQSMISSCCNCLRCKCCNELSCLLPIIFNECLACITNFRPQSLCTLPFGCFCERLRSQYFDSENLINRVHIHLQKLSSFL